MRDRETERRFSVRIDLRNDLQRLLVRLGVDEAEFRLWAVHLQRFQTLNRNLRLQELPLHRDPVFLVRREFGEMDLHSGKRHRLVAEIPLNRDLPLVPEGADLFELGRLRLLLFPSLIQGREKEIDHLTGIDRKPLLEIRFFDRLRGEF